MLEEKLRNYVELACPALTPAEKDAFASDLFRMASNWPSEKNLPLTRESSIAEEAKSRTRSAEGGTLSMHDLLWALPKQFAIDVYYSKKAAASIANLQSHTDYLLRATAEKIADDSYFRLSGPQSLPLFEIDPEEKAVKNLIVIHARISRTRLIERDVQRSFGRVKGKYGVSQHRIRPYPLFEETVQE